jgi:hypothetical protein
MTVSLSVPRIRSGGRSLLLCLFPAGLLSACHNPLEGDCVDIGVPALAISATDARTQQPVLAGASVILIHNGLRDSVTIPNPYAATEYEPAAFESGTYSIVVRQVGFQEWTKTDVVVSADRCGHPNTAHIVAVLTP